MLQKVKTFNHIKEYKFFISKGYYFSQTCFGQVHTRAIEATRTFLEILFPNHQHIPLCVCVCVCVCVYVNRKGGLVRFEPQYPAPQEVLELLGCPHTLLNHQYSPEIPNFARIIDRKA